jgi:hypothetical protein
MLLHNPRAIFSIMRHTPSIWKRPNRLPGREGTHQGMPHLHQG